MSPATFQNFLNFMQFFHKSWQSSMLAPPPTPEGWRPLLRECWIPPPLAFLKPAERSALSLFRFQKAQMNRFQDRDGIVTDKSKMYVPWHLDVSLNSKTCSVIFYVILFGSATSGKSWISRNEGTRSWEHQAISGHFFWKFPKN